MSQAKFAAARELIEEHQYAAARAVLETMDDPKARAWLIRLEDKLPQRQTHTGLILGVLIGLVLLSAVYLLASGRLPVGLKPPNNRVAQMIDAYCNYPMRVNAETICSAPETAQQNQTVLSCFKASAEGESAELFINCMLMNAMFPTRTGS
jgi:hypothetical protein